MKTSKYNVFFNYDDKIVGYNTISDNFIILEPILHELFHASIQENMIEELKSVHEDLYNILLLNGFIVNIDTNELDVIKNISFETDFNDENYELTINPTMNCNFKCWYCYETHIKDSKMTSETYLRIIKLVENILEEKQDKLKKFKISWFGGEPLLYFEKTVLPILKEVYPRMLKNNIDFTSSFTTNGLLINKELLEKCRNYGVSSFQITLDGHRDRHNQVRFISKTKGSYDEIINNIKLCLQYNFFVNVRINISEETIKDLSEIIKDFKNISEINKEFLIFSFHEVWQEEKNLTVDISNIVDEYRSYGFNSTYRGEQTASIKSSCYADKINHATINYNGEVFKCTARDFDSNSKEGILEIDGSISWNDKFQKRIYDTRFQNKPCLECKILPICNGGCSQHRLENIGIDYCVHNFDEDSKLTIIKEKFYTRLANKTPKKYDNEIINSLLDINFNNIKQPIEEVFQNSLNEYFLKEVRPHNLKAIQEINNLYAEALLTLRKNKINDYSLFSEKIENNLSLLELNDQENKVALLFALPVIAYYQYKLCNYDEAIKLTNDSILNDDYFLNKHPFLYGHKIQQLHNTIRILLKSDKLESALKLCNYTLNHLIYGKEIKNHIGFWHEKYDIKEDINMIGMIFQIFTETVRDITTISNSKEEEEEYFNIAFGNLINKDVIKEILPIFNFLLIKNNLLKSNFNSNDIANFKESIVNSPFCFMCYPLIKSIFISINTNSYRENKKEFDKAYI